MPLLVSRLRRWFAAIAIAAVLVVAGTYFYARWRVRDALKEVPGKLGIEIQQTAEGFTVSRSEQGRTLFKVQASKAIQLKQGGITELHDVAITLYGRDSGRFDQIYGKDFTYNPQTGDVTADGEVQIDLEANPEGLTSPDQTAPKELKNPIHLKTSGLVFNQKTGNAYTREKVEFRIPQASGSAVGVDYVAKTNVLNMQSQVNINFTGSAAANLTATRGTITKDPRRVVLDGPVLQSSAQRSQADQATLFLRRDNTLDRLLAKGNVQIDSQGPQPAHARSEQLELFIAQQPRDTLRTAIFSGDVHVETAGSQPMQGDAGRVVMDFTGKSLVSKVHAEQNVKLLQHQPPSSPSASAQDLELTAPAVDFFLAAGRHLQRAETSAAAQIAIRPTGPGISQQTLVTAGKFEARFDALGQLSSVHGAPDARIVTSTAGQPDRVSTSQMLDVAFRSTHGIESIVQQGNVAYMDGDRKAWAERARYTPADLMLVMTGSPRVAEGGMTTTSRTMRLNRATGDAFAEDDVKSTYSDLKPQPGGALLASSAPIHVTARDMTAHRTPAVALYTGDARLWQDANIVEAPSIQFDREQRSVVAQASASQAVSTVLVQTGKDGKTTPITITSARLTYADSERKAHFEGGVRAEGSDVTITSRQADVFLQPRTQTTQEQALTGPGKIDHMVAQGQVAVVQPARRATGDQLVYTAASDQFVMTGGPPSIFDAERGKITGVSLTFFRHDDRVLVEGSDSSPTVTHTRVAR